MDFLMDYLPAIQFVAALNIGYIIPNILQKIYDVLENINVSYEKILEDVKNKAIVKNSEVCNIHVVKTTDQQTTQGVVDKLKAKLNEITKDCEDKGKVVKSLVDGFIGCIGCRSIFLYSALYAISALLLIPFCHQHSDVWAYRWFFYVFTAISLLFIIGLFLKVLTKKSDVSCRKILWIFFAITIISAATSLINSFLPTVIVVGKTAEDVLSWMSIVVSFIPGAGCLLFLTGLILYSIIIAKRYAREANVQFIEINKKAARLDEFNKLLSGEVTLNDIK